MSEGDPDHPVTPEVARFRDTLLAAIPGTASGGIYAEKPGFHNTVENNLKNWPNNYSVALPILRVNPRTKARGFDLIFPEAKNGDYRRITLYSRRLLAASERRDPRLSGLYEWFGTDFGRNTGFNIYKNRPSSSDDTHDWHLHFSFMTHAVVVWSLLAAIIEIMLEPERDTLVGTLAQLPGDAPGTDEEKAAVWYGSGDWRRHLPTASAVENVMHNALVGRIPPIKGMEKCGGDASRWHLAIEHIADLNSIGLDQALFLPKEGGGGDPSEPSDCAMTVLDAQASAAEAAARVLRDAAGGEA